MKSNYAAPHSSTGTKNAKENIEGRNIMSLHLNNVSINYNDEMLNNISLKLKPGNTYGFVGNTEKRKLLINLIYGFARPTEGNISVNDTTDISQINNWASYIKLIKKENQLFLEEIVRQDSLKRNGTVDNITKTALLNATAKTLLKTSPVLIFDEAMSLLSLEIEEQVLREICLKNKNSIIILNTNRPGSLKYCDHIFLVKSNRISEVSKRAYFSDLSGIFNGFSENYYNESIF